MTISNSFSNSLSCTLSHLGALNRLERAISYKGQNMGSVSWVQGRVSESLIKHLGVHHYRVVQVSSEDGYLYGRT